jgi:hypothetical protein
VPENTSINAEVSGGNAGIVGAKEVYVGSQNFISNFFSATPQAEIARPTGPIPPCPYPGLAYFGPNDASRFFGREEAIQALVGTLAKRSFTALVGASGSGKSSVILAGLAPRLETQGDWRSTYFRIGTEPDKNAFAALARALAPLLGGDVVDHLVRAEKLTANLIRGEITLPNIVAQCRAVNPAKHILLIADQFEEVFTLVPDVAVRNRFIDALIAAFPDPAQGSTLDVSLVLTLRADFVSQAINYRPLADKLKDRVEYLGPMTREELRDAIMEPAKAVGVEFEPGLVDTILDDVEKRLGSLPLLQFALREMWGRLTQRLMMRRDYDAIGGVEGALAKRAQAIFDRATQKGEDEAAVALFRQLFTRLVTLGEGPDDTRRIVGREELGPGAWALAQRLADEDNRLVVTAAPTQGGETAEVVHEALIRNWPTLVDWVNRDRGFLAWRNQLKSRLDDWRASPSDDGTFLRGGPLALAERWTAERGDDLNEDEKTFVAVSVELRRAEQQREKDDREREQDYLTAAIKERAASVLAELRIRLTSSFSIVLAMMCIARLSGILSGNTYSGPGFEMLSVALLALAAFLPVMLSYSTLYYENKYLTPPVTKNMYIIFLRRLAGKLHSNSINNYLILGCVSLVVSFAIFLELQLLFYSDARKSLFLDSIILSLQAGIYTIILAVLMDAHTAGWQGLRPINRICDGTIIAIVIGIFQFVRTALVVQSVRPGTDLDANLYWAFLFIGVSGVFAIGWYVPATAAAAFMRARLALHQCSTEISIRTPEKTRLTVRLP